MEPGNDKHRSMTVLDGSMEGPCPASNPARVLFKPPCAASVRLGITTSDSRSGFANCQQGSVGGNSFRVRSHSGMMFIITDYV